MLESQTLRVPLNLFHVLEDRAKASGKTVDDQVAEILTRALADEAKEAELMAEIRKAREEMAARGISLTDEFIQEAKRWGRE